MNLTLEALGIKQVFNRRTIFRDVSFLVSEGQTLLITGRNGAGKSTLVKIIADVLSPTAGDVRARQNQKRITERRNLIGLVSPYLQMYDEFTAEENLEYALSIRGMVVDRTLIQNQLKRVFLSPRKNDAVRTYSSGMKQRIKYAFALIHDPAVLILDEPTSNLDAEGITLVKEIMQAQHNRGILIVATNDISDVDHFDSQVDLNAEG